MHELSVTRSVVAICSERCEGRKVVSVTLEVGRLSCVMPDAIRFCFDLVAEGTPVHGAELRIQEVPGRASCNACNRAFALEQPYGRCDGCGSARITVIAGEDLRVREMEVQ